MTDGILKARSIILATAALAGAACVLPVLAHAAIPIIIDNSDGSADFFVDDGYGCDETGANCDTLDIEIHDETGRIIWHETGTTDQAFSSDPDGTFKYVWSCRYDGAFDWEAKETGRVTDSASGTFHVARCKPDVWRHVSYGTAARGAVSLIPDDEDILKVHCFKADAIRGGRAGEWGCATISNSVWRVCDRFFLIDFYRHAGDGGRGPYRNKASYTHFARTRCWAL